MKKLSYLLIVITLIGTAACHGKKKAAAAKQPSIYDTKIEDFISIAGVTMSDLDTKTFDKLGQPNEINKNEKEGYSFASCYYKYNGDDVMSLTYDKTNHKVNHIRLKGNRYIDFKSTHDFLASKGVNDIKAKFLGMHKDTILQIFGPADRVNSGNYEYKRGPVSATFICYDFQENKCSEIYIFWNYYWKEQ